MGMSVAEIPAALLAPSVERLLGPGLSQPLFLVAPLFLVLAASLLAGIAAARLGGGPTGQATAIVLCGLGSPLGSYAAMAFSEPLQAASLAAAFAAALGSAAATGPAGARRGALLAGASAGCALLAKSLLAIVVPLALLPLLIGSVHVSRAFRVKWTLIGLVPPALLWAAFEFVRFGRPLAGYPGERFSHPVWDGLWRLLVGPNAGIVLFFPAVIIALWAAGRTVKARDADRMLAVSGAVGPFLILLGLSAGWWAWHGVWGWGPRLLVPAIPLLAACASAVMTSWRRWTRRCVVLVSVAINIPGLIQHPIPITNYVTSLTWPAVSPQFAASLAGYARRVEADGTVRASPDHVLATIPQASPFVVFPWFFRAVTSSDPSRTATLLDQPPWSHVRPDILPVLAPMRATTVRSLAGVPRWRFWGRGFRPSLEDAHYAAVYDEGLADQIMRLQQHRDGAGALRLSRRLVRFAPSGWHDAILLESHRLLRDREGAGAYLRELPADRRREPAINVVLALFERDAGNEASARQLLDSVAFRFPGDAPLHRALGESLDRWPGDLQSMIAPPEKAAGES